MDADDAELLAWIAAHDIDPTVDALLAELDTRSVVVELIGPNQEYLPRRWYSSIAPVGQPYSDFHVGLGPTPLIALARAFVALVGRKGQRDDTTTT